MVNRYTSKKGARPYVARRMPLSNLAEGKATKREPRRKMAFVNQPSEIKPQKALKRPKPSAFAVLFVFVIVVLILTATFTPVLVGLFNR